MSKLLEFAAFLEREGGYSVVCLALIVLGAVLVDAATRPQIARDLVVFATGVLARSMGTRTKPPGPPAQP